MSQPLPETAWSPPNGGTVRLSKSFNDDTPEIRMLSGPINLADLDAIQARLIDGPQPIGNVAAVLARRCRELAATVTGIDAVRASKTAERLERQAMIR